MEKKIAALAAAAGAAGVCALGVRALKRKTCSGGRIELPEEVWVEKNHSVNIRPVRGRAAVPGDAVWVSSDPGVLTAGVSGRVLGKTAGEVEVSLWVHGEKKSACRVHVWVRPRSVVCDDFLRLNLKTCSSASIRAKILPEDEKVMALRFFSGDPGVADVDEYGVVHAKAPGTCVIVAVAEADPDTMLKLDLPLRELERLTASCVVTVREDAPFARGEHPDEAPA